MILTPAQVDALLVKLDADARHYDCELGLPLHSDEAAGDVRRTVQEWFLEVTQQPGAPSEDEIREGLANSMPIQ
jgi:hypothetical protein